MCCPGPVAEGPASTFWATAAQPGMRYLSSCSWSPNRCLLCKLRFEAVALQGLGCSCAESKAWSTSKQEAHISPALSHSLKHGSPSILQMAFPEVRHSCRRPGTWESRKSWDRLWALFLLHARWRLASSMACWCCLQVPQDRARCD